MLDRKFRKSGLECYNYHKTQWYQTIRNDIRSYRRLMMFWLLGLFLIVPVVMGTMSLILHDWTALFVCLTLLACLVSEMVAVARCTKTRYMIIICLIQIILTVIVSPHLARGEFLCFFLLPLYSLMVPQLRGSTKGLTWFCLSMVLLFASYAARSFFGIPLVSSFSHQAFAIIVASSVCIFILSWYSERRHESLVGRLTDMLVFDPITGLPNKGVLSSSIFPDRHYIFAIIKIENFSDLVALFGYEFSDIISQFASQKLLKYESRFHYKTYQLKYNEYGILVESKKGVTVPDAAQCLNDIIKSLELESLPWERDRIKLVYCVGGAIVNSGDAEMPFSRADVALKKSERGHSAITIFEDDNDERESAYKYAIRFTELINNRENQTFRAVFQPVFSSDGVTIEWYEALLRIKQKDGAYSTIYPYLGVAKSTGFYQYLTDFILRKSAEAIYEYDVDISINISINDIIRPDFIALVDEAYDMIRDKKGRLIFEILESDELVELDKCIWFIDYIAQYGFKIAIDDFGTGYSNYCNLVNLPVDIVKIDGSLIKKIKNDENARLLVEGIIHFCKKSNKKTVAEYVEDIQVFDSLRDMNIDFLQGYFLSEPAQIAECPRPSVFN